MLCLYPENNIHFFCGTNSQVITCCFKLPLLPDTRLWKSFPKNKWQKSWFYKISENETYHLISVYNICALITLAGMRVWKNSLPEAMVPFLLRRLIFEPRHEKTCLRGLRPAKTQTDLLYFRSYQESCFGYYSKYERIGITYTLSKLKAANNKGADQTARMQKQFFSWCGSFHLSGDNKISEAEFVTVWYGLSSWSLKCYSENKKFLLKTACLWTLFIMTHLITVKTHYVDRPMQTTCMHFCMLAFPLKTGLWKLCSCCQTCGKFQKGIREIFLSFQWSLSKMYRIYRKILNSDEGDFEILLKSCVC